MLTPAIRLDYLVSPRGLKRVALTNRLSVHAQMDELTQRFFRILTELAVRHCAASQVNSAPGQPGAVSFMATDALARLIVTLVIGVPPLLLLLLLLF